MVHTCVHVMDRSAVVNAWTHHRTVVVVVETIVVPVTGVIVVRVGRCRGGQHRVSKVIADPGQHIREKATSIAR